MSFSALNFPHLHNVWNEPENHMGALREVSMQERGLSWQRAQPKQTQESGKAPPTPWVMEGWRGCP